MRFNAKWINFEEYCEVRHAELTRWHSWFAWRPVRLESGECVWLEYVSRKGLSNRYLRIRGWRYGIGGIG